MSLMVSQSLSTRRFLQDNPQISERYITDIVWRESTSDK